MADNNLFQKYGMGAESDDPTGSVEFRTSLQAVRPKWESFECTKNAAPLLNHLELDAPPLTQKSIIQSHREIMQAAMNALEVDNLEVLRWLVTVWYDMLRDDSSCFTVFEYALKTKVTVYASFMKLLQKPDLDLYVADKAAWILSAVVGNSANCFEDSQITAFLAQLSVCTSFGRLDAIVNLLKADNFRDLVWKSDGVEDVLLKFNAKTASAPHLYKCVFGIWMLSFDHEITEQLKNRSVIHIIKELLMVSKVEKVVRLSLTVVRNFLSHRSLSEDVVEENIIDAVQQLEFEKWRDQELYDDIRDMVQLISNEMAKHSSFERYERELKSGCLSWGFIHSQKFWKENILKFEQNNFSALKLLCTIVQHDEGDLETLAVACHDIGQFVTLHPLGKKIIAKYDVKDRIMELMSTTEPNLRDVRREALLCCQKMMLNNWQAS